MRAVDTNVVARFLLNDDPEQSRTARQLIEEGVFFPPTVLLETAWLLRSRYQFDRRDTAAMLLNLIDLPSVVVSHRGRVRWALMQDSGDLADLLHIATSAEASVFTTFDRGVAAAAGTDAPLLIETLA